MTKNALLLTGGGARAAYQVGVLKAIDDYVQHHASNTSKLFDIYCGVSAGAINAVTMATGNDNPHKAIDYLVHKWQHFHVEQVYRADNFSIIKNAYPWLRTILPFHFKKTVKPSLSKPMSFLDNEPLKDILDTIPYGKINELIAQDKLHAVSVTCSSYHTGQSVTFFEGHTSIPEWYKERRIGIRDTLDSSHLLASSSLPLIFPAQKIKTEWFGDGSMRHMAPLSSAVNLGADKILVVGTGKNAQFHAHSLMSNDITLPMNNKPYPSLAQIGGHLLNGLFVDSLLSDIDRLNRTNEMIKMFGKDQKLPLRQIDLLVLNPSRRIDEIASQFVNELPQNILKLLDRIGATQRFGGGLASYLLFEKSYCKELIQMGYEDTWVQRHQVADFLNK